jgi:hypothetical protein
MVPDALDLYSEVLGSNLGREIGHPEVYHEFPQSLQANSGIILRLGHDRFLPNPFTFIIHKYPAIRRYMVVIQPCKITQKAIPNSFPPLGVGWDWVHLVSRPLFGLLYQYGAVGGMRIGKGNRSTRRTRSPVPLCLPQIPHDLGSHPDRRCGKPATNRLSCGTAYTEFRNYLLALRSCKNLCNSTHLLSVCLLHNMR